MPEKLSLLPYSSPYEYRCAAPKMCTQRKGGSCHREAVVYAEELGSRGGGRWRGDTCVSPPHMCECTKGGGRERGGHISLGHGQGGLPGHGTLELGRKYEEVIFLMHNNVSRSSREGGDQAPCKP